MHISLAAFVMLELTFATNFVNYLNLTFATNFVNILSIPI